MLRGPTPVSLLLLVLLSNPTATHHARTVPPPRSARYSVVASRGKNGRKGGGGDAMQVRIERQTVEVCIDDATGLGWLYVHPNASPREIKAALAQIDEAGYEELDCLETGDDVQEDEWGRSMIPLVRIWDGDGGD